MATEPSTTSETTWIETDFFKVWMCGMLGGLLYWLWSFLPESGLQDPTFLQLLIYGFLGGGSATVLVFMVFNVERSDKPRLYTLGIVGGFAFAVVLQNLPISTWVGDRGEHEKDGRLSLVDEAPASDVTQSVLGDMAEAVQERENVQEESTTIDQAFAIGDKLRGEERIKESVEQFRAIAVILKDIDRERAASAWLRVGQLLLDEGDYESLEGAIDAYDKAVRLRGANLVALNNSGVAKSRLGRYDEAIVDYEKAIDLERVPEAFNNLGVAKAHLGRYDEAIADYEEAIDLKDDYAFAYYNRGAANRSLDRTARAREDFEAALSLAQSAGDDTLANSIKRDLEILP